MDRARRRRLARDAEAVCRHYLSNGRREGHYWLAGDVRNTPGRSLFVRLKGPEYGRGAAGKWTDAATGEHGDLLDLIALNRNHRSLRDTLEEARAFLNEPARHASPSRIAAPPRALGRLRNLLPAGAKARIRADLSKDLLDEPAPKLRDRLSELLRRQD